MQKLKRQNTYYRAKSISLQILVCAFKLKLVHYHSTAKCIRLYLQLLQHYFQV